MKRPRPNPRGLPVALILGAALLLAACSEPAAERGWDIPTDPREKAAYDHAHGLKLPDSLPEPVPFNFTRHLFSSKRTTAGAYFEHLCKTEAGEYIFRTVDKVEGIYQMRPMPRRNEDLLRDRYGFEDPADWSHGEADGSPMLFIGGPGNGFRYFESPRAPRDIVNVVNFKSWVVNAWDKPESPPYWKYHGYDGYADRGMTADLEESLNARHAYTWRGIKRERDREFGIAGGELVVLDRLTGEILGVRRSFALAKIYHRTGVDWEFAYFCPDTLRPDEMERMVDKSYYPFSFIFQVLRPIDHDNTKTRIGR